MAPAHSTQRGQGFSTYADLVKINTRSIRCGTGVPRSQDDTLPWAPTVGPCLWTYGSYKEGHFLMMEVSIRSYPVYAYN